MKGLYIIVFSVIMVVSSNAGGSETQHWVCLASVEDPEVAQEIRARAMAVVPDRFFIVPMETDDGRVYEVSGGPYMREALAEQLLAEVRRAGFEGAWISRVTTQPVAADAAAIVTGTSDEELTSRLDPALYDDAGAGTFVDRPPPGHRLHRLHRDDDDTDTDTDTEKR